MKEGMIMDANVTSSRGYVKGARSAKNILKDSIKEGITFSAELIVLSILLLIYSGVASAITIGMIVLAVVLLIATLIARSVFVNKVKLFYSDHPEEELVKKNEEYVDTSMSILKMGTYTAIVNIVTVTLSLITVCILIVGILN
jgi:hypothetical protein